MGGFAQVGAAGQPVELGGTKITQTGQTLEGALDPERCAPEPACPGPDRGRPQTRRTEIIGGDKAIPFPEEDADAGPHAEGRADVGDRVLFGEHAQVVGALEEHLHQIGTGPAAGAEQRLQAATPAGIKTGRAGTGERRIGRWSVAGEGRDQGGVLQKLKSHHRPVAAAADQW